MASGLLGTLCFPPFNQSWLCWIALTPLIVAIWFSGENSRRRWLRNLLLGYVAGIVFFTFTFSWLGALGDLYQSFFLHGLSLLLSTYLAMHFAFWAWFIGSIRPPVFIASWRNLLVAFVAASAWVTHEWTRGWLFSGFGWNGLGVALHAEWPMIQIAELTGVVGLSFAIVFANIIAVTTPLRLFAEARTHRMRPHFDLTLTMIGIVALLVSHSDQRIQIYRKIHLVPFGEYIPLRHSFPLFAAIASTWVPGDFARGTEHTVFSLTNADVRAAPLICFEDTVGDLVRRFVVNGANLLVDVTNDGWFLHSSGSRQHVANALFRCVENRRPMVRAANTGVTCFVNEFGRVTQILQDDTGNTFNEGVLTGEINVPQDRYLTFYAQHGELFAELCAAVTAVAILAIFVLRRKL